ncbi:hypothetical protein SUGI_0847990 [Cryptomeria japonica]|uniref:auxin-responsive protein SAUR50 n=1 Tax=Cryptomeria japonica TaxID=3369 RepID=UPI0024149E89|nr:auxin-responsive protein SAUR50 [Cryptomeria japonica]GLJ40970.1 hypothetical protein SUGI_0847990 [Cryptomeria japonica]
MERSQIRQVTKKLQRLRSFKQILSFKLRRRSAEEDGEKRRRDEKIVPTDVCEGHVAVYAAKEERKRRRFVIPLDYLKHPVFKDLLRMAEEEFGFDYHTGLLTLPCDPLQFEEIINGLKDLGGKASESSRYTSLTSKRSSCRSGSASISFNAAKTVVVH